MLFSLRTSNRRIRPAIPVEPNATDTPGRCEVVALATGADPGPITLATSETFQLDALGFDLGTGDPLTGFSESWSSNDTGVATVSSNGLVTGVAAGSCIISCIITKNAVSANDSLNSAVTVSAPVVTQMSRTPATIGGSAGGSSTITMQALDAGGSAVSGQTYTATSDDTGVASTSVSGNVATVTFVAAGTCTITCDVVGVTITEPTTAVTVTAAGSDPNRPTDVTWVTAATMPLTSNAAMTTGGLALLTGTMGTNLGTADGSTYSVNDGNATLTPGVGPVDAGGRIAWFRVRTAGQAQGNASSLDATMSGAKSLFFDFTIQMSADWDGHSSSQCKTFWATSGSLGVANLIISAWGANTATPRYAPYWQGSDVIGSTAFGASSTVGIRANNLGNGAFTRGVWKRCQMLWVMNSADGVADGFAKWWINGNPVGEETGIEFAAGGGSLTFKNPILKPYWGGQGDSAPYALYLFMDYAKISYSTSRSAG